MSYSPSISDKISFNSTTHELTTYTKAHDVSLEQGGALMDGNRLSTDSRPSSRNTELRRALDERHVNMIAFSTTVGIGCFLQSGKIINIIGPGGAVMAYLLMGAVLWSANAGLGEMTAVFPVKGPIIDFCGRFIDESVGFTIGWMAWFAYCILTATEISVVAQTFNFSFPADYLKAQNYPEETLGWAFGQNISGSVWVALGLFAILFINLMPVRIYGEIEYFCGCVKLVMMVLMIMFNAVISGINASNPATPRFWTYQKPYSFFTNSYPVASGTTTHTFTGDSGRLLAIWTAMNTIFFSLQGFFVVSVTAAENRKLETDETIKLATRKIALRAITLYALLTFTVGLNVPFDDKMLVDSSISSIRQGNHSPFIVVCIRSGVTVLPHILNAFFIFSAFSCGVNGLYTASRLLHALASIRNVWPRWAYFLRIRLERTTSKGVPMGAVFASWFLAFLGFLGGHPSPAKILGRLATLSTASMMIVYAAVSAAFFFYKTQCTVEAEPTDPVALETEDMGAVLNRASATYPYRSHLQWLRSAFAFVACCLFLVFNGWKSFLSPFSAADFLACYISIPIFIFLVAAYHIKDEATWNPLRWTRRVTMNVQNPLETRETNPLLRRGRLHRGNTHRFWTMENFRTFGRFFWIWVK